jgi:hypothetical protein
MKLTISSRGDDTVGIFSQTWEIECPIDETDEDERREFKARMIAIYQEFADDACEAQYEDECEDEWGNLTGGSYFDAYAAFLKEDEKRRNWASEE